MVIFSLLMISTVPETLSSGFFFFAPGRDGGGPDKSHSHENGHPDELTTGHCNLLGVQ